MVEKIRRAICTQRAEDGVMRERAIRSGDEPVHARSPLQLRLVLAVFGVVWSVAGVIVFVLADAPILAAGFAVVAVIAVVDSAVVVRHIREGPHYQPGPDVPPYHPADPPPRSGQSRPRITPAKRLHRYLALMCACLVLLVLAWSWVRLFSTGLVIGMTLVAMVIPPLAAVVANAGALDGQERARHREHGHPSDSG